MSLPMVGILSPATDYSDKDSIALRARIQSLIQSVFPDWTDYNVANFGNMLVEAFSFVGGVLTYYQDNQAGETRWGTATQRRNLINLAKMIGFKPASAKASTVDETFTVVSGGVGKVVLPKGSVCQTTSATSPIKFQTLADLITIAAGANPRSVTSSIENSETHEDLFDANGLPGQQCRLSLTPYIDATTAVGAGNGLYTEVTDLLSSGPNDLHYVVQVDQNDRATIGFGDGVNGSLPTGTIDIKYKIGGGDAGNVEPGTIKILPQAFSDEFGNPVTIAITNAAKASGGTNRQTVQQIQRLAPLAVRARNRSVAKDDFEINALTISQVARALCLSSDQDSGVPENTGILFIVPQGGGLPSQVLKDLVLLTVTQTFPSTLTFVVLVQNPLYLPINFSAVVFPRQGVTGVQARADIVAALSAYFAVSNADGTPNPKVDFGFNIKNALGQPQGSIAYSDLFDIIKDVTSIRKIGDGPTDYLVNGTRLDVPIANNQFPTLGTVSLVNGDTGAPL